MHKKIKICLDKITLSLNHSENSIEIKNKLNEMKLSLEKLPPEKSSQKKFIDEHLRIPLNKIITNIQYQKIIHPHLDLFYETLRNLAEISPRNAGKHQWECPITLKTSSECDSSVALTTGYIYDKEALLDWFHSSEAFIDPATRTVLTPFDVNHIHELENGLKKIEEIKLSLTPKKNKLIEEQRLYFSNKSLKTHDMIKKNFLQMTSLQIDKATKNKISEQLLETIQQLNVPQNPPVSTYQKDISGNFSCLNLSGLYFDETKFLVNPYGLTLDLRNANLSHCIFFGDTRTQNAMHANLTGANLEKAEFLNLPAQGISIETSNFTNANLKNVNFTGVSNWTGVNLTHANLIDAYLYNKDGIKITGENFKNYLYEQPNIIGIEHAFFEEKDLKASIPPQKNKLTLDEFKKLHGQRSYFSKMQWGLYFGVFKTMEDVERYARDNPESRTSQILASFS